MIFKRHNDKTDITAAINTNDFGTYQIGLVHDWLRTVTALVFCLVPLFFLLDTIILPGDNLARFAIYRGISTALALGQFLIIINTPPSRFSYLHGYFASAQVGAVIAMMTVYLGGFDSSYYVGLILVMIGVSLVLPWRGKHTAINAGIIILMYVAFNLIWPQPYDQASLVNNMFFLVGAAIIAVAITELRYRLIANEFELLVKLKQARDSLWSEMELARDIQLTLLPRRLDVPGYEIAATMQPAKEVGGDYYDVITTDTGGRYVAIGDVAGHGLSAGLIMMMAQTSLMTVLKAHPDCSPSDALKTINSALRENVGRLGSHHYMTMTILRLGDDHIEFAGHHQDILIHKADSGSVTVQPTSGTWLGIVDNLDGFVDTTRVPIAENDVIMLYTDGLTEAASESGEMFGDGRLERLFARYAKTPPDNATTTILDEIRTFQATQNDDMTVLLLRKTAEAADDASVWTVVEHKPREA
ncbi:PP2C family protein-serine/threonine phosphatase [Aquisalimonas asiatica]|uniref:Serine phosphatase RsbU, regulator of sigma subunit n=1 Tax=Aquisalimonas asiatica TaxID=406100 RepID=A0A1H8SM94_9GAMM|nr:PP2C family protein-serine/threonine phosphatase [Aquisalimonas asiatica]SEO80079.1 Serine phosphatase RsbU, regulator of sigma subunit [Aquisalimonas asiatica]